MEYGRKPIIEITEADYAKGNVLLHVFTKHTETLTKKRWEPEILPFAPNAKCQEQIKTAILRATLNKAADVDGMFVKALRADAKSTSIAIWQFWGK